MKQPANTAHKSYARLNAALDAALELMDDKGLKNAEHIGAGLILCGLLTIAFVLEGSDESKTQ